MTEGFVQMDIFCSVSLAWYPPVLCCRLPACCCGPLQSHSRVDTTAFFKSSRNQGGFIKIHLVTVSQRSHYRNTGDLSVKLPPQTTSCFFHVSASRMSLSASSSFFIWTFIVLFLFCPEISHTVRSTIPLLTLLYSWKITWECSAWCPIAPNVLLGDNCHFLTADEWNSLLYNAKHTEYRLVCIILLTQWVLRPSFCTLTQDYTYCVGWIPFWWNFICYEWGNPFLLQHLAADTYCTRMSHANAFHQF